MERVSFRRPSRIVFCLLAAMFFSGEPTRGQESAPFQHGLMAGTPLAVTGELSVIYRDDFESRRGELMHIIRDGATGRSFRLRFEHDAPSHLRTGSRVTVRGRAAKTELYISAADGSALTIAAFDPAGSQQVSSSTASQASSVSGEQKTIVIVGDYRDVTVACSIEAIRAAVFDDPSGQCVNALYRDMSAGQTWFSGDVVGPFTLDVASTDPCDITALANEADSRAAAAGVNLGAYARIVYVMPPNNCPGAGFGTLGGQPSRAWVFTCDLKGVFAHEIGHNLGLDHAATIQSDTGDTTDPMAFSSWGLRGLNAPHREQLSWLNAESILPVVQSGVYDIAPLALDPTSATAPRVIRIAKPDSNEYYYLSYRLPLGFDTQIDGAYYERVSVHQYKGDGSSTKTLRVAGLSDGQNFVDSVNGITITQLSHESTYARVAVDFSDPAPTCSAAAPSMTMTPQAQSGAPGDVKHYAVELTNRDTSACAPASFILNAAGPAGWNVTASPATLVVAAGASAQAMVSVTSAPGTPAGSYSSTVTVGDGATPTHAAAVSASYTVVETCVPAALAMSLTPEAQNGIPGSSVAYSLTLTNRDSSACSARTLTLVGAGPAGWNVAVAPSSLTIGPGRVGQAVASVVSSSSASSGIHPLTFTASDAAQSVSATAFYNVAAACTPGTPTMVIAPANQSGHAGSSLAYTVSITNRDSAACAPSAFGLQWSLPAGWLASASSATLTLAAGQGGTVSLTVSSAPTAVPGSHPLSATAIDTHQPLHIAAGTMSFNILAPGDTVPPSAPGG